MLAAAPLTAQDGAAPADLAGRNAVSLDVGGGYVVGLWRQATSRVRVGIEAGVTTTRTEGDEAEDEYTDVVVQPSVKFFSAAEGSIRPYTLVGVYGAHSRQRSGGGAFESGISRTEAGARAGVGLEWMPVDRVAVGGHVGVRGGWARRSFERGSDDQSTADGWSAATFTSGVVLTLFF